MVPTHYVGRRPHVHCAGGTDPQQRSRHVCHLPRDREAFDLVGRTLWHGCSDMELLQRPHYQQPVTESVGETRSRSCIGMLPLLDLCRSASLTPHLQMRVRSFPVVFVTCRLGGQKPDIEQRNKVSPHMPHCQLSNRVSVGGRSG